MCSFVLDHRLRKLFKNEIYIAGGVELKIWRAITEYRSRLHKLEEEDSEGEWHNCRERIDLDKDI